MSLVSGTPSTWFGGKWEMDWILDHFPHQNQIHTYVETHGGMAGLMLQKTPSPVEVYNDVSSALVTFWRAVREYPAELARAVELTPVSYEEWYRSGKTVRALSEPPAEKDEVVETARRFVVMARQSMAGAPGRSWQTVITHSRRGMASPCSAWLNMPEIIRECGARFSMVEIEHRTDLHVIAKYDTPSTLFYVDPPYFPGTCKGGIYAEAGGMEMSATQHALLLRALMATQGSVILSGYDNPMYEKWLVQRKGWRKVVETVPCRSAVTASGKVAERTIRTEVLWIKYAPGMIPDEASSLFN